MISHNSFYGGGRGDRVQYVCYMSRVCSLMHMQKHWCMCARMHALKVCMYLGQNMILYKRSSLSKLSHTHTHTHTEPVYRYCAVCVRAFTVMHKQKNSVLVSTSLNFNRRWLQRKPGMFVDCPTIPPDDRHTLGTHTVKNHWKAALFQGELCASLKGRNMLVFCGHGKQADGCINKACWNIWSLLCVQLFNVFKEQLWRIADYHSLLPLHFSTE